MYKAVGEASWNDGVFSQAAPFQDYQASVREFGEGSIGAAARQNRGGTMTRARGAMHGGAVHDGSLGTSWLSEIQARAAQLPHPAAQRCPPGSHGVRHFNRTLCIPNAPLHGAAVDGSLGFQNAAAAQQYWAQQAQKTLAARGSCPPGKVQYRLHNRTVCITPRALHGAVNDGSLGATVALLPQLTDHPNPRPRMPPRHSVRGMGLGSVYRDGVLGAGEATVTLTDDSSSAPATVDMLNEAVAVQRRWAWINTIGFSATAVALGYLFLKK